LESIIKKNFLSELQGIDWDFVGETTTDLGLSFHWYPARFVPQIPSNIIGYFSEKGDTVLDLFCGSGTSLVEAFRLDRIPIGVDINPVATLISKARLSHIETDRFDLFASRLTSEIATRLLSRTDKTIETVPNLEENARWYHPDTLTELASIYSTLINLKKDSPENIIGKCCFSAILNKVCSQDRHFGWVCDGVHPNKYIYKDAESAFAEKLKQFRTYIEKFQSSLKITEPRIVSYKDVRVYQNDARDLRHIIKNSSVDLVVSSPPYLSVTDYNKSFRLTTLWFSSEEWKVFTIDEIGARYKRSRQRSLDDYISDSRKYVAEVRRVLRPNKYMCLVVGQSSSHPAYIAPLIRNCNELGFHLIDSIGRNISIKRRLYPQIATEDILIFQSDG